MSEESNYQCSYIQMSRSTLVLVVTKHNMTSGIGVEAQHLRNESNLSLSYSSISQTLITEP